jgi:Na+/melibiose symporter-like transporter
MARKQSLETWRTIIMVLAMIFLVVGVVMFLQHADDSNRGVLRFVAAGWTLIILGFATFFWELIDTKLEALHAADASILSTPGVSDSSIISALADIYKTGPFNRVLMITGLVIMLAAGAKGGWIDLPSVAVSIGDTNSGAEATPLPIVAPTEEP